MRWVTENGKTAHVVNEEATGYYEVHGAIVASCGWVSNEAWLKPGEPVHCRKCERMVGGTPRPTVEEIIAARVEYYATEWINDESPVTKARAAEAQAILDIIREEKGRE